MKAYAEPSASGGTEDNDGRKRDVEIPDESVEDEYHEGRNWAVILILIAIIISWSIGLAFLIWSLLG
jgi:hypothetical protein